MSVKRVLSAAKLCTAGSKAGLVILPGGVDVELGNPFASPGALTQAREGYGFGILTTGPNSTDLVAIGGACTKTPNPGDLESAAIGTSTAGTLCGANAATDYYELHNQGTGILTKGAAATPATPANAPALGGHAVTKRPKVLG